MKTSDLAVEDFLDQLPDERKAPMNKLREEIKDNLPSGFVEILNKEMIDYPVPHELYPPGYHCNPKQPLPFISLASQKSHIALYHMGLYSKPELLDWFTKAYQSAGVGKLDMGKSCIRFKKPERIPFALIGELCTRMTPQEWIDIYEKYVKR